MRLRISFRDNAPQITSQLIVLKLRFDHTVRVLRPLSLRISLSIGVYHHENDD